MDSQSSLKQRTRGEPTPTASKDNRSRRDKRMAMAKRGFRSLAVAVSLPVSLSLLSIYLGGSSNSYAISSKPFWFPPLWALHFTTIASSFLMGLSAWLVWAQGGFHKKPMAAYLYLTQLAFSLAWDPIVFGFGSTRAGLIVCLGMLVALLGCSSAFKQVNPIAGDVMKPCIAWNAFLAIVNFKLIFI
ncbi:translocator protein homolog [Ziziphus jujuba]|uniref:Translocator protein homolog n=2 Tax=Ziziphus jujuba TaxID=326968 RepID=A0A6P4AS32_ZIZJJ|nr:translocator protein homolog [Ziziphus jujuba]KAH7517087.1 hypothetical protein FEM48_Zijuj09G0025100 [Ziziphus jujuba var. spinosa]